MAWAVRQYGAIVDRFRGRDCDAETWAEVQISFGILLTRGPVLAGPRIAKKLRGGDGIWELRASNGNIQPRLLFYDHGEGILVFVHAFIKKGDKEYVQAINLAKERRRALRRGGASIATVRSNLVH
jgi:phage-related protein